MGRPQQEEEHQVAYNGVEKCRHRLTDPASGGKMSRTREHRAGKWTILNEVRYSRSGHEIECEVGLCIYHTGRSRDRKRGCRFRNWLHSLLRTVTFSLLESWLTTPFFPFLPCKGHPLKGIVLFSGLASNLRNEAVCISTGRHMICVFSSRSWLLGLFVFVFCVTATYTYIQTSLSISATLVTSSR